MDTAWNRCSCSCRTAVVLSAGRRICSAAGCPRRALLHRKHRPRRSMRRRLRTVRSLARNSLWLSPRCPRQVPEFGRPSHLGRPLGLNNSWPRISVGTAAMTPGRQRYWDGKYSRTRVVAIEAGGIAGDHAAAGAQPSPPTAATMASEIARLSTGHLALMLMTSAPSSTAASMPAAIVERRASSPWSTRLMTIGSSRLFGRDARDADAVVHAAADRAGHLGAVRDSSGRWSRSARSACRPASAAVRATSGAASRSLARSSCAASMPESSTATMRGSERAATPESQPIFVWPHSSSMQGSLGNVVRAARCQQLQTRADGRSRAPCEVVRKSGPSQSGSAYSTCGELMIAMQAFR